MPTTYTPIATQTLTSSAANVTFSSVPSTYTDLIVVVNGTITGNTDSPTLRFNSDSGTNYSSFTLQGNGGAVGSYPYSNNSRIIIDNVWGWFNGSNNSTIYNIFNYTNTSTYKSVIGRNINPTNSVAACAGLWMNTAAITSVIINGYGSSLAAGSTITLYGIKAA